jgi:phage tail-like protein
MNSTLLAPPVAFHFTVGFGVLPPSTDSSFQEVSGISAEMETESLVEGGENRFVHKLPKAMKHPNLVLKRGVAALSSPLVRWCRAVLEGGLVQPIEPRTLHVFLLDADGLPVRAWSFDRAWPLRWEIEAFGATKNELALEKIEFAYAGVRRDA